MGHAFKTMWIDEECHFNGSIDTHKTIALLLYSDHGIACVYKFQQFNCSMAVQLEQNRKNYHELQVNCSASSYN